MNGPRRMHFGGSLSFTRNGRCVRIGAGFASCCSGDRTRAIAAAGAITYLPEKVTCKRCIENLVHAERLPGRAK